MSNGCDCKECQDKRAAKLEGIELVETKIEEEFKRKLYSMGMPKAKIKGLIEQAKNEVG